MYEERKNKKQEIEYPLCFGSYNFYELYLAVEARDGFMINMIPGADRLIATIDRNYADTIRGIIYSYTVVEGMETFPFKNIINLEEFVRAPRIDYNNEFNDVLRKHKKNTRYDFNDNNISVEFTNAQVKNILRKYSPDAKNEMAKLVKEVQHINYYAKDEDKKAKLEAHKCLSKFIKIKSDLQ